MVTNSFRWPRSSGPASAASGERSSSFRTSGGSPGVDLARDTGRSLPRDSYVEPERKATPLAPTD